MKNCPSCNVKPEAYNAQNGMGYRHTKTCEIGRIVRVHSVCLCDCQEDHKHNSCDKCGATFTMKNYLNPGDSLTGECPICWTVEEAKNK